MNQESDEESVESFDYSTPEAVAALAGVSAVVLEIREEYVRIQTPDPEVIVVREGAPTHWERQILERKISLYEKSLGLAVIPVLLRRGLWALARELRGSGRSGS